MIGELVAARPALARLFEKLGIDYCCGGKQTLAVACSRRGLEVATTITLLESAGALLLAGPTEVDAAAMSLAVNGFVNDLVQQFPMEYSVELKRLIDLEMEGSVG